VTALVALFVGVLTFGATLVVLTTQRRVALHRQLGHYVGASTTRAMRGRLIEDGRLAHVMDSALERTHLREAFALRIDRAGLDSSPGAVASVFALAALGLSLLAYVAGGAALALVVLAATPFVALFLLAFRAARRARAFEVQLPELLDNLSASLRAGHGFDQALQNVATDIGEPAGREFRRIVAEVHLGRPLDAALTDLGKRVRSEDLEFVLDAITIQRQVGGSLAGLFALVAETVRQREQFRRKLKAITGLPRMSARVLTGLPILVALALTLINHHYMAPFFTTTGGRMMLLVTAAMMTVGSIVLRRVGSVKP
jgi:tight adherence protein B